MYETKYNPAQNEIKTLKSKLSEHNTQNIGDYAPTTFLIEVKENRQLIGGLYALLQYGWLYIDLLWVHDQYRGQGVGKQLLVQAESIAKEHGIYRARLNTATFQIGPSYYQRLGYYVFAQLPVTTNPDASGRTEHVEYFMRKEL